MIVVDNDRLSVFFHPDHEPPARSAVPVAVHFGAPVSPGIVAL